ncbi:MAG: UbiA-like polyprenyltransferase [Candidatus Omnitrophota bacterium]
MERLKNYLGLVRFSHTVFALPFALASAAAAARGIPGWRETGWILFCMIAARTSAMTFNRIVDCDIDWQNPRTQMRHLPAGIVTKKEAILLWLFSSLLFVLGAYCLNALAFRLSPLALAIICGYSYCKRFTSLSHFVLGLSLGIAPIGAWVGVTGTIGWTSIALAGGVLLWVAGFDVIYALMDEEFDRRIGLNSLVVRFGKRDALRIAFVLHILSAGLIFLFGWLAGLSWIFFVGAALFAALILYEHSLVKPDDLSKVNIAFFNVNGIVSIGLFVFTLADVLWRG